MFDSGGDKKWKGKDKNVEGVKPRTEVNKQCRKDHTNARK
jgi:hypothetical protein|tara:strand:+ start:248 stop:367 length:120 start_codon:yes stop_codon:yes gene_type:complete